MNSASFDIWSDTLGHYHSTKSRRTRLNQDPTAESFVRNYIDEMYLAAAKVGGIHANHASPANFMHRNLMVEANVIHEVYASGVRKLLFLDSPCIYPKLMA